MLPVITWHAVVVAAMVTVGVAMAEEAFVDQTETFVSGRDGYHTYRIPAMVVTTKGTVLAFCEGRKEGISDHGNIHIVLKRSADHGKTWGKMGLVWKEEGPGKKVTIGNPCAVVDHQTGAVWLAFCRDNKRVFVTQSADDGRTWSRPREITESVKNKAWGWYATGPGNGIQLTGSKWKGRLVIPCDHTYTWPVKRDKPYYSHVIFSDDHGKTWKLGGSVGDAVNECAVVELVDGTLLLNMRVWDSHRQRAIARSVDGGKTWSKVEYDRALPDPRCQGSMVRLTDACGAVGDAILFSNAADPAKRVKMTVRLSHDGGLRGRSPDSFTPGRLRTRASPSRKTARSYVSTKVARRTEGSGCVWRGSTLNG